MVSDATVWAWPWWWALVTVAALNLFVLVLILVKTDPSDSEGYEAYRRTLKVLGTIFVSVGIYRSVFVSGYLYQLAWFDTVLNSSLLIRGFAWFAELAFAAIIALVFLQLDRDVPGARDRETGRAERFIARVFPVVFFLLIFSAQFFATAATITKFITLFAIEETLWGAAFLFLLPVCLIHLNRVFSYRDQASRQELRLYRIHTSMMAVFTVGYVCYSLLYHLPLEYWPYAMHQFSGELVDPAIRIGWDAVSDAFYIVNETKDYATWGGIGFVIWYSGYFSICMWMVLFMMTGPRRVRGG
ncbi:MAG: hypothetical protein GWP63_08165 [Haliea sp.]|jgi:hypothetical protein|nr:hypothetical protein [Haliea sp.]